MNEIEKIKLLKDELEIENQILKEKLKKSKKTMAQQENEIKELVNQKNLTIKNLESQKNEIQEKLDKILYSRSYKVIRKLNGILKRGYKIGRKT